MKLPNGSQATIDPHKVTDYCLSPDHEDGQHKAHLISSMLGLTQENADLLLDALRLAAATSEAVLGKQDKYGQRYVIDFKFAGPSGTATIRSAWIIGPNSNVPRLVTLSISGESRVGIMETLPPCPWLTTLTTPYSRGSVGDEGLQTIVRHCPKLTHLYLNDSEAHSLVPLSRLRTLQRLHCWAIHLNDAAIATLAELPSLYSLGIEVPDRKCMQRLAKLDQKLREFIMRNQDSLGPESLTDAADWQPVTRFANLEQLTIMDLIAVDAASLQAVAAMPRLKAFSVSTNISEEDRGKLRRYTADDIAAFRKARPDVEFSIDDQVYPRTK